MILAIVLSALVLFGWTALGEYLYPQPKTPPAAQQTAAPGTAGVTATTPAPTAPAAPVARARDAVIGESPRVAIETPKLKGSIALKGARIDDLELKLHTDTIKKDAKPIQLLSPAGTKRSYFAGFGWTGQGLAAPGPDTLWTADSTKLTPATPVTLSWDNAQGQIFRIKLSVDKDYQFSTEQTVTNNATGAIGVQSYSYVSRSYGLLGQSSTLAGPAHDVDSWTMHVGPIGTFNNATNFDVDYKTLDQAPDKDVRFNTTGGWLGFGDTYWLTAVAPAQGEKVDAGFRKGGGAYQAEFVRAPLLLAPGKTQTVRSTLFAGAKEVDVLDRYQNEGGLQQFGNAIDWGWYSIIAKPIYKLLHFLFKLVGNFGVAIMLLTLIVKALMFPIAQKQFASMAKMKIIQPKLKAIQDKYKDDRVRLQQEMMALYQKEKVSPAAGCLPIFIQIPVFYALYKVLLLAVEMRHQPFVGWIKDLSAPDPVTPVNLFGLLPFQPPSLIALGVLPILLGITMWWQFKLNPQSPDPIQAQVFSIMPWIMMFMMAPFAAGLQLYWVTNNLLTIAQQKWLYSRHPEMKAAAAT
jgi:YidC/Oxa1 family membrane protein insertase